MPAQVIVKLIADPSGLQPGIDELEQLGKVDKDTANQFNATNKAFQERSKVIQGTNTATDKLAAASKKLVESIAGGAISQATKNIEKIADGINDTNSETVILNKTLDAARQKLSQLDKDSPDFEKLSNEIAASELAFANLGKEATSSRGKLRQYRETLLQLEDAGLDGTKVFEDLAQAAGELEDQVGDTQARIKVLASDTFKFDVAIQAVQGITGAFAVAQGAAALFGSENEDLQKALLKVNAAMSILQGLQSVQAILQKESALNIGATIALQKIAVVQTNLQAAAESRNIAVRYAAIVAQRALNLVMAANPAGVVLFAIAALATGVYALTRNTEDAAEAQKKLNEGLKISIDLADEYTKSIGDAGDLLVAQLEAQGATEAEIRKQRIRTIQGQLNEIGGVYRKAQDNYNKIIDEATKHERLRNAAAKAFGVDAAKETKEQTEQRLKAYDLLNDAAGKFYDIQKQLEIANLNDVRDANKERVDAEKDALDKRKKAQEDAKKVTEASLRDAVAGAELQFLNAKTVTERLTAQIVLANSKLRLTLNNPDIGPNARALAERQTAEEIKKFRDDMFKDLDTIDTVGYRQAIERQKVFNKERVNEEVLIGAALAAQRLKDQQSSAQAQLDLIKKSEEDAKRLRERLQDLQLITASSIAGYLNDIARNQSDYQLGLLQKDQETRLAILQKQKDDGLITEEQYKQRQLQIQEEYDKKTLAIRRRAAQQEKQLALFQAAIATSLAILAVLRDQTIPLVSKPIFIALAVAQAAAQAAAIASKPLPAFKKGTNNAPGGPSLIGEAGAELYYADGRWGYAAKPTILDLPKGAKVIPAMETSKIMNKYDIPLPRIPSYLETPSSSKIDYKTLAKHVGKEVGAELEKLPLTINGYDKDGPWQHTTTMQNRHRFVNKKFGRHRR